MWAAPGIVSQVRWMVGWGTFPETACLTTEMQLRWSRFRVLYFSAGWFFAMRCVFPYGLICALGLEMLRVAGARKPAVSISVSPANVSFIQHYDISAPQLYAEYKVTRSDGLGIDQIDWKSSDACVFIGSDPKSSYGYGGCNKTCGNTHTAI